MLLVYTSLVAALHFQLGSQVGTHFLEVASQSFSEAYGCATDSAAPNAEIQQKEAQHLLSLILHLYNARVIHCTLVYDLIRMFCKNMTSVDVTLLLIVLQIAGSSLRIDDPAALREIVLMGKCALLSHLFASTYLLDGFLFAFSSRARENVDCAGGFPAKYGWLRKPSQVYA